MIDIDKLIRKQKRALRKVEAKKAEAEQQLEAKIKEIEETKRIKSSLENLQIALLGTLLPPLISKGSGSK